MENDDRDLWRVSRREILALSASVIAAVSFGGMSGAGISHAADIRFPEGRCGGKMKKSVLIAYASKYGSTGEVADAIGKELCAGGVNADVALIRNVRNISSYQGVVVGSAVYMGEWMPEAVEFVKKNRDILRQMPVAYFLVCMTMRAPTEENRRKVLAYLDPVHKEAPQVKPVGTAAFAGALHYSNLSLPMKIIMKSKGAPEGDFRDWNAIRAWARDPLYAKFVQDGFGK